MGEPRFAFFVAALLRQARRLGPSPRNCSSGWAYDMFDWVRNNKRLMQVILGLIILPFAFFGLESYQAMNSVPEIATVGDQKITEQEFTNALRQQQDRMRGILGRNFDSAMLDTPEMRTELLDGLISQRLLIQQALRSNLNVSDEQLREFISAIPAFQQDGRFSGAQYEAALRAQGLSVSSFENSLRHDLMMQQLSTALSEASIASRAVADRLATLRVQQREVSEYVVRSAQFAAQIKPSAEAIQKFYDDNRARYQIPEQVRVEYVLLNADALAAEPVPAEEIRQFYEANAARFGEPEQRQVSHILVGFNAGASAADKAKALDKANQLAGQIKKSPSSFADLARKNSDDPGSAAKGGDLGYFGRGMMVKAFEDAAFSLKQGETSDPVLSDFGYHIIRVTGIRPGKTRSLEQARAEIEAELKKQRASRRFAEAADVFSNMVYEQADSLKPVADRFKLTIRQAEGWTTRDTSPEESLRNPKVLAALFSDDALKNKRNSEAVEITPGTLLAARVLEHKAAAMRPLEEVKSEVTAQLIAGQARDLARKDGAAKLAALQKGESAGVVFGPARIASRDNPQSLRQEAFEQVFKAGTAKLPAYAGVDLPEGYAIYRISKVIEQAVTEEQQKALQEQLARVNGSQEFSAYIAALRAGSKVVVNNNLLQKREP